MFLKATRFSFLAVKFNYASLFFHLTFRRIIQDMKVNLQILFRIFCKYLALLSLSCGIFQIKLCLFNSDTKNNHKNTFSNTQILEENYIKHPKSVLIMIYWNNFELCPCQPQMVTLCNNIFWKQDYRFISPKLIIIGYLWTFTAK